MTSTTHTPQADCTPSQSPAAVTVRLIGGPTALIEIGGLCLLTDPTFDAPGPHPIGRRALVKTRPPAIAVADLGPLDAVLLSHDQHPDNLDDAGRRLLPRVPVVLSTVPAAARLGGNTIPMEPWHHVDLARPDGGTLRVTSLPAQHGPDHTTNITGEVIGFLLSGDGLPNVYVSGDNASLRVVHEIAVNCSPTHVALLFAGAARTPLLDAFLTLTSDQAAEAARILDARVVVPLHAEGWEHFTQGPDAIAAAFERHGQRERLRVLAPGESATFGLVVPR